MSGQGVRGTDPAEDVVVKGVVYKPGMGRHMWRHSYLAAQEIDQPAADIIREGYSLEGLPEWADNAAITDALESIGDTDIPEDKGASNILARLYAVGNIDGGGALAIVVRDGLESWEPLDLDRIEEFVGLELLERDEITPHRTSSGGEPEHYVIGTSRTEITPGSVIHRSRLILTRGRRLGPREEWNAQGWGASVLEKLHGERLAVHGADQAMGGLVTRTTFDVKSYAHLSEQLCDDKSAADLETRMAADARAKSQYRVIQLDGGKNASANDPGRPADSYATISPNVRGVADLANTLREAWAGATRQTPSIALGKTAGPFSSGDNAGDWQSWGGYIAGEQKTWLEPRMSRVLEILLASKDGPTRGRVPETWTFNFNPLWKPSAAEDATTRATEAGNDAALLAIDASLGPAIIDQRVFQGATGALRLDPPPVNAEGEEVDPETGETLEQPEPEDIPPDEVEDVEPTESDIAWSEATPPADAATATSIAADLGEGITANLVHSVAKTYGVTAYKKLGHPGVALYRLQDIKEAMVKRQNGESPDDVPES